jgi:hypothetical protein
MKDVVDIEFYGSGSVSIDGGIVSDEQAVFPLPHQELPSTRGIVKSEDCVRQFSL